MDKLLFCEKVHLGVFFLELLLGGGGQLTADHPKGAFEKTHSPKHAVSANGAKLLLGGLTDTQQG